MSVLRHYVIQVLQNMQTDVRVGGKPVLAVSLGDVESSLQHSIPEIRRAIEKGKLGYVRVTKDFLLPGSDAVEVHREEPNTQRKCEAILLHKLDEMTVSQLKARKY